MKVLVIEDDAETACYIVRALQEAEHEAASRSNGRDGLKVALANNGNDALLMMGESEFTAGTARELLTETHLQHLYGVPLKRLSFEHGDRQIETFVPVLVPYAKNRPDA